MLTEKITQEELDFMELWHYPPAMAECLFSNFDDLGEFDEERFGEIRTYQLPMLSYEAFIDTEIDGLTEMDKFNLRKSVGDLINTGARNYGKTLISLRIDITLSALYDDRWQTGFYSIDEKRLRGVLDYVKLACEHHPIVKMWKVNCSYRPSINFHSDKNNWMLVGINMTIKGKEPGHQFYQLHAKKLWGEEVSFETKEIYDKRKEAVSELGVIVRLAGMTNFTKTSPIGKMFFDRKNQCKKINYPQYVSPYWSTEKKEDRIKDYGGEEDPNFRIFVEGEVLEDGISEFDMERIGEYINRKNRIKRFEIKKDTYKTFRNRIILERPKNANRIFVCGDIGDGARGATEIIVLSEVGNKYNYIYNIVLYNLKKDEQYEIFKYIIEKLEANVIAFDCGEALGRVLADDFTKLYSEDNIVRYAGNEKITVGFQEDEKGNVVYENGKPVVRQEFASEWAVTRLKELLYNGRCYLPEDAKFETQFSSVISTRSGTRTIYCVDGGKDHHFDAWKVFSIAQWNKKDFNQTKPASKSWGLGASSW